MTIRASIEPGNDLIGRFGDTVVLISRAGATEVSASELLQLVAELAADREAPSTAVATRLASWVLGHLPGNIAAFGIVAPVPDGVVVFLRGPVRCTVSAGDAVRHMSGEQALTWVDQILPGTFDWLAISGADDAPMQVDPMSDLQAGVVPGRGFVLSGAAAGQEAGAGASAEQVAAAHAAAAQAAAAAPSAAPPAEVPAEQAPAAAAVLAEAPAEVPEAEPARQEPEWTPVPQGAGEPDEPGPAPEPPAEPAPQPVGGYEPAERLRAGRRLRARRPGRVSRLPAGQLV